MKKTKQVEVTPAAGAPGSGPVAATFVVDGVTYRGVRVGDHIMAVRVDAQTVRNSVDSETS